MTISMSTPATATERIIAVYDGTPGEPPLASRCRELFSQQMFTWQEFAAAHLELNGAWLRELSSGPHTVLVQFNPGRTVNATAAIDDDAVRNRPCFLCPDRLPVSQAAVRYREDFLILVNPRPIFSPHYTVVHIRHLPQHLEPHIGHPADPDPGSGRRPHGLLQRTPLRGLGAGSPPLSGLSGGIDPGGKGLGGERREAAGACRGRFLGHPESSRKNRPGRGGWEPGGGRGCPCAVAPGAGPGGGKRYGKG